MNLTGLMWSSPASAAIYLVLLSYLSIHCIGYRRLDHSGVHPVNSTKALSSLEVVYDLAGGRTLLDISEPEHLITLLPGLSDPIKQYAGHLNIDPTKYSNVFYWLIEAPTDSEKLPLLIWLNGGPGCSSMDGLWLELGPLRLQPDGTIKINPHSWHYAANMLFVDQPVGTGFAFTRSKSGFATNDEMVNEQFYKFLLEFFKLHPRYVSNINNVPTTRQFFMSGESHAGHYIPSIAAYILQKNAVIRNAAASGPIISLVGIALGNPWLDPYYQYDASAYAHAQGLISVGQRQRLEELERKCQNLLKAGKYNNPTCFSLLDKIVDSTAVGATERVLMYDTRKFVPRTSVFPPGHEPLEQYLNRPDVKSAIHASRIPHKFEECTNPPFYALAHQDGKGISKELASILNSGLRVLVFAGQYDMICNHIGIEKALGKVPWQHQKDWLLTAPGVWAMKGRPVGSVRAFKNLEFLIVFNAGHMVPMDQPAVALNMIRIFLQNKRYATTTSQSKLGVSLVSAIDGATEKCALSAITGPEQMGGSSMKTIDNLPRTNGEAKGFIERLSFWQSKARKSNFGKSPNKLRRSPAANRRAIVSRRPVDSITDIQRLLEEMVDDSNGAEPSPLSVRESNVDAVLMYDTRRLNVNGSTPSFPYILVLGHVTPLNSSVLVHVRLVHHATASHLQQKHHTDRDAVAAVLKDVHFEILVEPGHHTFSVDTSSLLENHFSNDIVLPDLLDGQEYTFSTHLVDAQGVKHVSSRRSITVTPGCFNKDVVQCCGHGICARSTDASSSAHCVCDAGHTGMFCSQIGGSGTLDHSVTCPTHFHAHIELLKRIPLHTITAVKQQRPKPQQREITPTNLCPFLNSSITLCGVAIELYVPMQEQGESWDTPAQMTSEYGRWVIGIMQEDIASALDLKKNKTVGMRVLRGVGGSKDNVGMVIARHGEVDLSDHSLHFPITVVLVGPPVSVATAAIDLLTQLEHAGSPLKSGMVSSNLSLQYGVIALRNPILPDEETMRSTVQYSYNHWLRSSLCALLGLSFVIAICMALKYRISWCDSSQGSALAGLNSVLREKDGTARV